jgi:hypothetical protein
MIKLMLICNDGKTAQHAVKCGVNRLFVDLEIQGKRERQGHRDTLISGHTIEDVARVRHACAGTELLVRVNPLHAGTAGEVAQAINAGADMLMLPMFDTPQQLSQFATLVNDRAKVVPLVETPASLEKFAELVALPGIDEIYIGLNDLHMAMGMAFMFEPVANGMVEAAAELARRRGIPFGFGGIARMGEGLLPGEMVLAEHLRLGSSAVILSRTFHRNQDIPKTGDSDLNFCREIQRLRAVEKTLEGRSEQQQEQDHLLLVERIGQIRDDILGSRRP